jgi:Flp pilus assembly pilin Flp
VIFRFPEKMPRFIKFLPRFLTTPRAQREGQTLVEYALILAVISIVLVSVFALLSGKIIVVFSAVANMLDTAQAGS